PVRISYAVFCLKNKQNECVVSGHGSCGRTSNHRPAGFHCANERPLLRFCSHPPTANFSGEATRKALRSPEESMRKFQGSSANAIFAALQHSYRFGEFTVDAEQKVLLRKGAPLPLTPKVFD